MYGNTFSDVINEKYCLAPMSKLKVGKYIHKVNPETGRFGDMGSWMERESNPKVLFL